MLDYLPSIFAFKKCAILELRASYWSYAIK